MTRAEYGASCPLWPPHGPRVSHTWIETTLPGEESRRFSCDLCSALAVEAPICPVCNGDCAGATPPCDELSAR